MIAVICLLSKVYRRLFPSKNQPPHASFEELLCHASGNWIYIFVPVFLPQLDIKKPLRELRAEFWQKDIVVPIFQIQQFGEKQKDFNCFIKIDGVEVFKGMIEFGSSGSEAGEKIISEIRKHFLMDEAKNLIEEKGEKGGEK